MVHVSDANICGFFLRFLVWSYDRQGVCTSFFAQGSPLRVEWFYLQYLTLSLGLG